MNQENMLMGILNGRIAKEDLELKGIKVDEQFDLRQALIAAIIDDPWLLLFLLQSEVRRYDNKVINPAAQAKIVEVWNALKADLCQIDAVEYKDSEGQYQIILNFSASCYNWADEVKQKGNGVNHKQNLIDFFLRYFINHSGVPITAFDNKCKP
jgi:hypothetical protein